jgi:putative addiction module component (TIGR02574 family)
MRMASAEGHLAELLRLPLAERARAARALLDSVDDAGNDEDADEEQLAELLRRMKALETGQVTLIENADARARLMARLRSVRGR